MAIDVSQLTIKVVSDGIDKATSSLNKLAEASTKVESSTMVVKTSTDAANASTSNATKVTTSYIDKLQTKVDLLGKDNAFSSAYIATQKKLGDENIILARSLGAKIDSYKQQTLSVKQAAEAEDALQKAQERGNALNLAGQRATQWKALSLAQAEAIKMNREYNTLAQAQEEALAMNSEVDKAASRYKEIAAAAFVSVEAQNAGIASQRVAGVEVAKAIGYSQDLRKAQNAQMASAAKVVDVNESVSASFSRSSKAAKQQVGTIDDLLASLSPTEKGLQKLAVAEEALYALSKKGLASSKDVAEGEALITAKRATLVERQAAEIAKATGDASKGAAGLLTNAGAMREFFVVIREAARGDFSRMAGSISILVDRLSLMGVLLGILTSPITWLLAALAGVAALALQGADETNKFNQALILTGNYAGITAGQMENAAAGMKEIAGQHAAAQALTEVANTGRFAGDQVAMIGKAALQMKEMTGQAVKDTIKQFEDLGKSPAEAVYKLDQQYHFLTADVYEQIRALDEQGKHQEAAELAAKTYADTINNRAPQVIENLGAFERAWRAIKKATTEAIEAGRGIGRDKSLEQQKQILENTLATKRLRDPSAFGKSDTDLRKEVQAQLEVVNEAIRMANRASADTSDNTRIQSLGKEALKQADDHLEKMKGEIRLQKEINEITERYVNLRKAEQNAPSKAYEEKLAGVKFGTDGKPVSGGLYDAEIADAKKRSLRASPRGNEYSIDKQIQDNKNAIQALVDSTKLGMDSVKAQYSRNEIDTETYLQKDYLLKADAYTKEYALAEKNLEIASQKKNVNAIALANKEIQKLQDGAVKDAQAYTESLANIDAKRKRDLDKLTESLVAERQARQRAISDSLAGMSMSGSQQDDLARQRQAVDKYNEEIKKLNDKLEQGEANGGISKSQYNDKKAKYKQDLDDRLVIEKQYTADRLKVQGDWAVGASKAFLDYQDSANNVAATVQNAFASGFKNMEDSLTTFFRTGKLNFSSFVQTVLEGFARVQAQNLMSKLVGTPGGGGGIGGSLGTMLSGLASGYGSFAVMNAGVAASNGLTIAELGTALADGGEPPMNKVSLVGERGPELFVPKQAGTIIPNDQLGGGGGTTVTYAPTIHIDSRADRAQVMQDVQNAVKAGNAQLVDDLRRRRVIQ